MRGAKLERLVAFLRFCGARRPEAEGLQESENKVIKVEEGRGRCFEAAVQIYRGGVDVDAEAELGKG